MKTELSKLLLSIDPMHIAYTEDAYDNIVITSVNILNNDDSLSMSDAVDHALKIYFWDDSHLSVEQKKIIDENFPRISDRS